MRGWIKLLAASLFVLPGLAFAQCVSLTGGTYTQNFDTLSSTAGSTTNNLTIPGWFMTETGGGARDNEQYAVDTGASNTGDTFSYGATGNAERALGSLRSGTLIAVYGSCYTNNTGATLSSIDIAYFGEQWRLGTAARTDSLTFEYSTTATSLTTGTWTGVTALNFVTPTTATTGAKDGNAAANRTATGSTIGSLSIANGASFWIRWNDTDAANADDALAIDDFSLTAGVVSPVPNLSINDVVLIEGDAGTTTATFTVSLSLPATAGGVTFDITTANNTATTADNDFVNLSLTGQTIPAGSSTYAFSVTINGDTTVEATETYLVNVTNVVGANVTDGQGLGTITNDDVVLTQIHAIQGAGNASPLAGSIVTTRGIVTGIRNNGFFMQTADADADADPATSQGIFAFTSTPPTVSLGNLVNVTGSVLEYFELTEIGTITNITVLSTGNPLPAAINLTTADGALPTVERYEGMRIIPNLTVVAPADGNVNETNATSTSTGEFYGVLPGVARPFREPGVSVLDTFVPASGVPVFDGNLETIYVQSRGLSGLAMNPNAGDILSGITGILDFGFGLYKFYPDAGQSFTSTIVPRAATAPVSEEFTVAGYNLLHMYDTVDDPALPNSSEPRFTAAALNNRLAKTADAICAYLKTPDVIGVIEVENIGVLTQLADTINAGQVPTGSAVPSCNTSPNYVPYLVEGNDFGGIDVGFLVSTKIVGSGSTPRVEVLGVVQENAGELFINPDNSTDTLNDRPSLRLMARVHHANGKWFDVTIIVNHTKSLIGSSSSAPYGNGWANEGARNRAKRLKQAESIARLVNARQLANPSEKIILVGDFNAYEFNDGLVDVMGIVSGHEAPASEVTAHSGFLIDTPLTNMTTVELPSERYSYTFDGNAQAIDHVLVNELLLMQEEVRVERPRINADFAVINYGIYGVAPTHGSDHDPIVLYVKPRSFGNVDLSVAVSNPDTNVNAGATTTFTVVGNNLDAMANADNVSVTMVLDAAINGVSVSEPISWVCAAPVVAAASTTITCDTSSFAATDLASFTVTVPVPAEFEDGDLTLSATISAEQGDTNSANNIGSDFVTVIGQKADLAVRTRGASRIYVGYKTRINTVADNYGPDAARDVAVAITTNGPASAFKITTVPAGWSCGLDAGYPTARFLCSMDAGLTMAKGQRPEFVLTFTAPASMASSNLIVGAGISSATADPLVGNNENSYSLYIEPLRGISPPQIPNN